MISLAALKEYLKIDEDETADDDLLEEMEEAAVSIIENETGRYFGPVVELVETLSGNGWAPIWLRADPLEEGEYVQPFALELRAFPDGTWESVADTDFEVDGGRLYPLVYWTPGRRTLRATYWAGYETGSEPADIQQAVRELVAKMYHHRLPFAVGTTIAELPYSVQQIIRANRVTVV